MGKGKAVGWAAMLLMLLGGCAGLEPVSQRDMESRTYDASYELVFKAVASVLEQKGHRLSKVDPQEGLIDTEPVEMKYRRVRISAELKPLGRQRTEVRARIELSERGLMGSTYKPEPVKMTMYDDLFTEIELQVYREHFLKIERK